MIIRSSSVVNIGGQDEDQDVIDDEEEDEQSGDQWDYTTALEKAEVVPFLKLMCVPSICRQSNVRFTERIKITYTSKGMRESNMPV